MEYQDETKDFYLSVYYPKLLFAFFSLYESFQFLLQLLLTVLSSTLLFNNDLFEILGLPTDRKFMNIYNMVSHFITNSYLKQKTNKEFTQVVNGISLWYPFCVAILIRWAASGFFRKASTTRVLTIRMISFSR